MVHIKRRKEERGEYWAPKVEKNNITINIDK